MCGRHSGGEEDAMDTMDKKTADSPWITPRTIVGLAFVALGTLFLLDNLGYVDSGSYWRWWPIVFIGIGLAKLLQPGLHSSKMSGYIFILVGGWLLLSSLDVIPFSPFHFWPVLLVLVGVSMIVRGLGRGAHGPRGQSASSHSDSVVRAFAAMGGVSIKNTSSAFRGGEASAVMGGVELDLRNAQIEGHEAVLDVFAMWGGIDLKVPNDWEVSLQGVPIMGAFEDSRKSLTPNASKRLVIKGTVIMGGLEVKD
jgi:predicted membrane protein